MTTTVKAPARVIVGASPRAITVTPAAAPVTVTPQQKSVVALPTSYILSKFGVAASVDLVAFMVDQVRPAIDGEMELIDQDITTLENSLAVEVQRLDTGITSTLGYVDTKYAAAIDYTNTQKAATDTSIAAISETMLTLATLDAAYTQTQNAITASLEVGGPIHSTMVDQVTAYATPTDARLNSVETAVAQMDTSQARYSTLIDLQVDVEGNASSQRLDTMEAATAGNSAAVTTNAQAIASVNGYASALYTLELDVNGKVSGFRTYNDGLVSTFDIAVDKFKVSNGTDTLTPFTIDLTDPQNPLVRFVGKTSFDSYLTPGTTTIDGGAITTDTLSASKLIGDTVWLNGLLRDSAFNNTPNYTVGFQLKANAAGTSADPNIYGAYIKGGRVEGAVFTSDSLRVQSTTEGNTGTIINSQHTFVTAPESDNYRWITSPTLSIRAPSYSSGFIKNRITDFANSTITVTTNGGQVTFGHATQIHLQISSDGSTWTDLVAVTGSGSSPTYIGQVPSSFRTSTIYFRLNVYYYLSFDGASTTYGLTVSISNSY